MLLLSPNCTAGRPAVVFFYLSKYLFALVQPSLVCLGLLAAGLIFGRKRLAVAGFVALLVIGFSPLGYMMLLPLENRFPRPTLEQVTNVSGIIILGGFEDTYGTQARGVLTFVDAAERLTEGVLLAHRLPHTRVVFTGGAASVIEASPSAAAAVADFIVGTGIAADRVVLESASRNTRENAVMTHNIVKPKPGERWLLVTSAFHMPRAMGVFRAAGFDVMAWPVGYRSTGISDIARITAHLGEGTRYVDTSAKELIGLMVYRLRGWTAALWPAPVPL
jgi:uncharacterized SAM-binding protein YcdF (DUF218 family)